MLITYSTTRMLVQNGQIEESIIDVPYRAHYMDRIIINVVCTAASHHMYTVTHVESTWMKNTFAYRGTMLLSSLRSR